MSHELFLPIRDYGHIDHDLPTEELLPAQAEEGRGSSGASVRTGTQTWVAVALLRLAVQPLLIVPLRPFQVRTGKKHNCRICINNAMLHIYYKCSYLLLLLGFSSSSRSAGWQTESKTYAVDFNTVLKS